MSKKSGDKTNSGKSAADSAPAEQKRDKEAKGQPPVEPSDKLKFEDLGDLPSDYGEMFAIARDPHWLYTYWDFDYSRFPENRKLFLDLYCGGEHEAEVEINEIARNWYIPVQKADAEYTVSFCYRDEKGEVTKVGTAGPTRTPPESISANWDTQFATVPFHLSFNFLLDVMASARAEGKNLTEALGQLQQQAIGNASAGSSWGREQIKILETLLGKDLLSRLFSMSSSDMIEFLHNELSGRLDSESASELLAKGRLASLLAPAETSQFSGALGEVLRQELSSGGVSSFGSSELGGVSSQLGGLSSELSGLSSQFLTGGSEVLASWLSGIREVISKWEQAVTSLGLSSVIVSSWQAGLSEISSSWESTIGSYGMSSETLSSWQAGVSEIFARWQSELSSYGLSSFESSSYGLSSETLASWQAGLAEITSSWEQAFGSLSSYGLSSYGLSSYSLSSEQLSSWNLASWSGLEFGLSSWNELISESSLFSGVGASWSAQPFGVEREFFMHVNAEVIFYGGTHPQAKVTIDGRPIQLQPDGTFRYHFIFPDNKFEIPIVAVSPDGVETRSAALTLERGTTRSGDVGATPQPSHLTVPMGARR
jgi:hypothetical protein